MTSVEADTSQYLPPEWTPQSGVMLVWPHANSYWRPWLDQVEAVFVEVSHHIGQREKLLIICGDPRHRDHVLELLSRSDIATGSVQLRIVPFNDTWARDYGPLTVLRNGTPILLDFSFNGWGGKYPSRLDNQVTRVLHGAGAFYNIPLDTIDLVLEGGSIDVDGAGSLLTTTQCLLSGRRNPQFDQHHIESQLTTLLGVRRILWLAHGYLAGDDTDSHVDTLARFCDPRTIAYTSCNDPQDVHFMELRSMENELKEFRDAGGQPYRLIPLPLPQAKYNEPGQRLPASYTNFLIINGAVLVPTYQDPADSKALNCIEQCFPGRDIIGINCLPLIQQYGSLHCLAMQLPAGVLCST